MRLLKEEETKRLSKRINERKRFWRTKSWFQDPTSDFKNEEASSSLNEWGDMNSIYFLSWVHF